VVDRKRGARFESPDISGRLISLASGGNKDLIFRELQGRSKRVLLGDNCDRLREYSGR